MKSPQFVLVAIASCAFAIVGDCQTLLLTTYFSFAFLGLVSTLKYGFIDFVTANCQIIVSMSTSFSFCCVFVGLFELMLKQLHIISSRPLGPTQAKPLAL